MNPFSGQAASAFRAGYASAMEGESVERAPFSSDEEVEAFWSGFQEASEQLADLAESESQS